MTREILYKSDGEGPSVVRQFECIGCQYHERDNVFLSHICMHKTRRDHRLINIGNLPPFTPSWCPIITADPETWQVRLQGKEKS